MKNLALIIFSFLMLFSCKEKDAKSPANDEHANSVFQLDSKWQNQEGKQLFLKDLKGKNLVVVLIFTSCQTACPLLVADMKSVEKKIDKDKLKETTLVLVSIDPVNDTPEVLKKYAQRENIDREPYMLLRGNLESTRELANVLAVKYKEITPILFSHSNIISVFDKNGEMVSQEEGTVKAGDIANVVNGLN
jgi:protein SCO1/2